MHPSGYVVPNDCVKQNLKVTFISCSNVHHMYASEDNVFQLNDSATYQLAITLFNYYGLIPAGIGRGRVFIMRSLLSSLLRVRDEKGGGGIAILKLRCLGREGEGGIKPRSAISS